MMGIKKKLYVKTFFYLYKKEKKIKSKSNLEKLLQETT